MRLKILMKIRELIINEGNGVFKFLEEMLILRGDKRSVGRNGEIMGEKGRLID